jgi:ankyrin repeat protein
MDVFRSPRKSYESGDLTMSSPDELERQAHKQQRKKEARDRERRSSAGSTLALFRSQSTPGLLDGNSPRTSSLVLQSFNFDDDHNDDSELDAGTKTKNCIQAAQQLKMPPLFMAAKYGQEDVVEQLLQQGFQVDEELAESEERTILHAAIAAHQPGICDPERMVQLLLERGADVHARNKVGNSPLMAAALLGDDALGLTKTLLRHGALSTATAESGQNEYGQTPLHAAIRVGAVQTMHELLKSGADLLHGDAQKQTAMHHASRVCSVTMMNNILAGDMSKIKQLAALKDNNGLTALHVVCASESRDMARAVFLLLENEYDPNATNKADQTPLHILAQNHNRCTARAIRHFANRSTRFAEQDRNGNTALHLASRLHERKETRKQTFALVRIGGCLFVPNESNETPLDLVPPGMAVEMIKCVKVPPDMALAERYQRALKTCTKCKTTFKFFKGKKYCGHCARVFCSVCLAKKYQLVKFGRTESEPVCDHCFMALTIHGHENVHSTDVEGDSSEEENEGKRPALLLDDDELD